jgi:hypothetical protein
MSFATGQRRWLALAAGGMIVFLTSSVPAVAQDAQAKYITFEAPGYIFRTLVNTSLTVAGFYADPTTDTLHGFVRSAQGTLTSFDPPTSINTLTFGINGSGTITGSWQDPNEVNGNQVYHGFVRSPEGTITSFDPPRSIQTYAYSINRTGAIAGIYYNFGPYGFVRSPDGTFTTFEIAGEPLDGIEASYINDSGTVAGYFQDNSSGMFHGYDRSPQGTITAFDPPGSASTYAFGINTSGEIAGSYRESTNGPLHGFVRSPQGTITVFDPPGSTSTQTFSINAAGAIAGFWADSNGVTHGFVRSAQGDITSFDPPGGSDTTAWSINDLGVIAGTSDNFGYLRLP